MLHVQLYTDQARAKEESGVHVVMYHVHSVAIQLNIWSPTYGVLYMYPAWGQGQAATFTPSVAGSSG